MNGRADSTDALGRLALFLGSLDADAGRRVLRARGLPEHWIGPPEAPDPGLRDGALDTLVEHASHLGLPHDEVDLLRRWHAQDRTGDVSPEPLEGSAARASLDAVLDVVRHADHDLCDRLGAPAARSSAARLYAVLRHTEDARTRRRIVLARRRAREHHAEAFAAAFDQWVRATQAHRADAPRSAADVVRGVLDDACTTTRDLQEELGAALAIPTDEVLLVADVPSYLRRRRAARPADVGVPVRAVLEAACALATEHLHVDVEVVGVDSRGHWLVRVLDDRADGDVRIVLRPGRDRPNHTVGLRNRIDTPGLRRGPVTLVESSWSSGVRGILTPQDVLSLVHELGHALAHATTAGALPLTTALERFTAEHAELLPLWFEAAFVADARVEGVDQAGLRSAWTAKQIERGASSLERAVVAVLDLQADGTPGRSVLEVWERIQQDRPAIASQIVLSDLYEALATGPSAVRPGTAWTYLWASVQVERARAADDRDLVRTWGSARDVRTRP